MPSIKDLKIKVRSELPKLVIDAKAEGFDSRLVKNGTIITLKPDYDRSIGNRQVFTMPVNALKGIQDISLSIDTTESGGGSSNTEDAIWFVV